MKVLLQNRPTFTSLIFFFLFLILFFFLPLFFRFAIHISQWSENSVLQLAVAGVCVVTIGNTLERKTRTRGSRSYSHPCITIRTRLEGKRRNERGNDSHNTYVECIPISSVSLEIFLNLLISSYIFLNPLNSSNLSMPRC